MNTSFVPAEKLTLFPLLDEENTVSRDNVDPDLAGELMRKELNVVAPDEVVVPLK
jgi:hypothetical protein